METKSDKVRRLMAAGEWDRALSIAARFTRPASQAIAKAHSAVVSPDFYRQIGKDPEVLRAEGIEALKTMFGEKKRA